MVRGSEVLFFPLFAPHLFFAILGHLGPDWFVLADCRRKLRFEYTIDEPSALLVITMVLSSRPDLVARKVVAKQDCDALMRAAA